MITKKLEELSIISWTELYTEKCDKWTNPGISNVEGNLSRSWSWSSLSRYREVEEICRTSYVQEKESDRPALLSKRAGSWNFTLDGCLQHDSKMKISMKIEISLSWIDPKAALTDLVTVST